MANSSPPRRATVASLGDSLQQPLGHLEQQAVADGVAEGVVHVLEAVEVE